MNNNKGTFKHSVPVPRLLKCAARYVREACENGASIKELVYEGKHPVRDFEVRFPCCFVYLCLLEHQSSIRVSCRDGKEKTRTGLLNKEV